MRRRALGTLVALALAACSSGDSQDELDDLAERLRECGTVSSGPLFPNSAPRPGNECFFRCLAEQPCEDLGALMCGTDESAVDRCEQSCTFRCGDGEEIPTSYLCDTDEDCRDGSDEQGCAIFHCDEETRVAARRQCDGVEDCPDGSDESGCRYFDCDDGERVPLGRRCDLAEHCGDGSDEQGCAELQVCEG